MPFVTPPHRVEPDLTVPGDRCYVFYKWMVDVWKKEPRWTTADMIYGAVMRPDTRLEDQRAKELAWQVFFQIHVMKYEQVKRQENGDI